jgi:5,10-methylenetetrahydrofolate reductase
MTIADLVKQGKFVISTEVGPPKGVDIQEMIETAELMRGRVDAINVTDQQRFSYTTVSFGVKYGLTKGR